MKAVSLADLEPTLTGPGRQFLNALRVVGIPAYLLRPAGLSCDEARRIMNAWATRDFDASVQATNGTTWTTDTPPEGTKIDTPVVHLAVAKPLPDGSVKLNLVVDGKTREFTVARHVAATIVAEVARALANSI